MSSSHNGIHTWSSDCPACLLESKPKAESGYLTLEMLQRAIEKDRVGIIERIKNERLRFKNFMAEVPEEFKDHPEIRAMAWIAAQTYTFPLHPKDKEVLARRYKEIVNGG